MAYNADFAGLRKDELETVGEQPDGCIWTTLTNLKLYRQPEKALATFCRQGLGAESMINEWTRQNPLEGPKSKTVQFHGGRTNLYALYVFSGPLGHDSNDADNPDYAPRFAGYLKKQKLGEVIASPVVTNDLVHAGRKGQVFMWVPNEPALKAWWKAYRAADSNKPYAGKTQSRGE